MLVILSEAKDLRPSRRDPLLRSMFSAVE